MKITCDLCGKRFNNEKYAGICPRCGHYMRSDDSGALNYEKMQERKGSIDKGMAVVYLLISVVLLITAIKYPGAFKKKNQEEIERIYQEQKAVNVAKEQIETGKEYLIWDIRATFQSPRIWDQNLVAPPKGWKYIIVPYESRVDPEHLEKVKPNHPRPPVDYEGEEIYHWNEGVYLLADEVFYGGLYAAWTTDDEKKLEKLKKLESDCKISPDLEREGENAFLFLIPEDVNHMTLYISLGHKENEKYRIWVDHADKVYLMNFDLEGENKNEE